MRRIEDNRSPFYNLPDFVRMLGDDKNGSVEYVFCLKNLRL